MIRQTKLVELALLRNTRNCCTNPPIKKEEEEEMIEVIDWI